MSKKRIKATMTIKFYNDHPPEIEMREGIVEVSEELFSKTLELIRGERNKLRVRVSNRQRRDERLREQEELSNG